MSSLDELKFLPDDEIQNFCLFIGFEKPEQLDLFIKMQPENINNLYRLWKIQKQPGFKKKDLEIIELLINTSREKREDFIDYYQYANEKELYQKAIDDTDSLMSNLTRYFKMRKEELGLLGLNVLRSNGLGIEAPINNPLMNPKGSLEDQRSKAAVYIHEYSKDENIGTILTIANNYEEIIGELADTNEWDGWLVQTLEEIESNRKKKWF